jgi:progressive ankylosis protein
LSAASAKEPVATSEQSPLTHRLILKFYSPLAFSWIFMALEGPVSIGLISRLPNAQVNTAAFLVVMGLALWIESPVIDLLSTSTTLAKNRQHFVRLSGFVWWIIAWVTVLHALVSATPVYGWLTGSVLNIPEPVARAAQPALIIMIPWSAFIGWRRYLQGILIRYRETRLIGMGTLLRVCTMLGTGSLLYWFMRWPGTMVAASALMASVIAEAIFVHVASRATIKKEFVYAPDTPDVPPLQYGKLLAFHLPLTATTMVMFLGNPSVSWALAQSPGKVLAMASYQVASSLLFLYRTIVFALPEVVITLYKDADTARVLRNFCIIVGAGASAALVLSWVVGLDQFIFTRILGADRETAAMARLAFIAGAALPLIGALQSYVRGMLTAHHLTAVRFLAVGVSIAVLLGMLTLGVHLRWTGVLNAAAGLTTALIVELGVLAWALKVGLRKNPLPV